MDDLLPMEELTDEQLVNMTEDEVNYRVRLRMAEEGVPILPEPVEPPEAVLPEPDGQFWETNVFEGFLFNSVEDVQSAFDYFKELAVCKKHDPYHGPKTFVRDLLAQKYSGEVEEFTIIPIAIRSKEQLNELEPSIDAHRRIRIKYEEELRAYRESKKSASKIEESIRGPIAEAVNRQYMREQSEYRMKEYMELSKGDFDIALGFYKKAYSPEDYIVEHLTDKLFLSW